MNGLLLALMMAGAVSPRPPDVSLDDLERFPPAALVSRTADFTGKHKYWLEERKKFWMNSEERDYWEARCQDQYWRWDVWTDLRLAQQYAAQGSLDEALQRLRFIRNNIGADAYDQGAMPPCCAIWLFEREGP